MTIIGEHVSAKAIVCLTFILSLGFLARPGRAQQNPHPFSVDLDLGGGLIGNTDRDAALQGELGLSYMPGSFGIGLKAGMLNYKPAFDAAQYTTGMEAYTSTSGADDKWNSFFIGIGPRFDFGGNLPVHFRSSLDLALSYNAPPDVSVSYEDPAGAAPLALLSYTPGKDYHKWSAALRPAMQLQFAPGGSSRFSINLTTGVQHRLSDNSFTYLQKDLSKAPPAQDPREMYFQLMSAPDVERTARPPKTNFFATVGISFKFGGSRHLHKDNVIHRDLASRNVRRQQNGGGDCDDDDPCLPPDGKASQATDYNSSRSNTTSSVMDPGGNGADADSTMTRATDYNSSRSNTTSSIMSDVGDQADNDTTAAATDYNSSRSNTTSSVMDPGGNGADADSTMTRATDYNSSRSNTTSSIMSDVGDQADNDTTAAATDYNSSRSNTTSSIVENGGGDCDDSRPCPHPDDKAAEATDYNSSRSNTTSSVMDNNSGKVGPIRWMAPESLIASGPVQPGNGGENPLHEEHGAGENVLYEGQKNAGNGNGSVTGVTEYRLQPATSHNASRSNRSSGITKPSGGDSYPDFMNGASLSISKRDARKSKGNTTTDLDESGLVFTLQINDPDDDDDGLMDAEEQSSFSIHIKQGDTNINQLVKKSAPATMKQWTYKLSPLAQASGNRQSKLMDGASLLVLNQNGAWHYALLLNGSSQDGIRASQLQQSSFSISKRSARTGRN